MVSTSTKLSKVGRGHIYSGCHCLCLYKVPTFSCLSGKCFKISKLVSFTYDLGTFQIHVFVLGSSASKSVHESLRVGSPFRSVSQLSWIQSSLAFKVWHVGGLLSLMQGLRVGSLMWSTDPSLLRKKFCTFETLPNCGSQHLWWSLFWQGRVLTSPTYLSAVLFVFCCGGPGHPICWSFSEEIITVYLLDPWEGASSHLMTLS